MTRAANARGFTLIEVMIALMIFGMIAAAGVALLSFSVNAQAATGVALDDVGALARTNALLSGDLGQAIDRPARDTNGTRRPAFVGESGGTQLLRLTRAGWSNLDARPRPSIQKVEYRVADGALQRIAYPMVDGAPALAPAHILDNVANVRLRYRLAGAWSDRWDGTQGAPLPQAMEMTIERRGGTLYRLMFIVGSGWRPRPDEAQGGGAGNAP